MALIPLQPPPAPASNPWRGGTAGLARCGLIGSDAAHMPESQWGRVADRLALVSLIKKEKISGSLRSIFTYLKEPSSIKRIKILVAWLVWKRGEKKILRIN